jgi:hypothetical protein
VVVVANIQFRASVLAMTASKPEILEIVIGGMAERIPPINPDANPVGYGEMTGQLIDDIFSRAYSVDALRAGMSVLRFRHKPRGWPTLAVLIEYLEEGRKDTRTAIAAPPTVKPRGWEWEKYVMAKYGDTAREKGIAYDLSVWAERNPGVEPTGALSAELVAGVERVDAKIRHMVANPNDYALAASWISLGQAMQEKRARFNEGVSE